MSSTPVGRVGRLAVAVRSEDAPGEVEVVLDGMCESFIAYAREPVARSTSVLVIADRGARGVDVVPWELVPGLGVDDAAGRSER